MYSLLSIYLSKFQILFILVNTLIYLKFRKCATAIEKDFGKQMQRCCVNTETMKFAEMEKESFLSERKWQ